MSSLTDPLQYVHEGNLEALKPQVDSLIELSTRFAIISHTWDSTELSYKAVMEGRQCLDDDPKFTGLCKTATAYKCRYVWMDSVCIDKSSSSELDESISSMFTWYQNAYPMARSWMDVTRTLSVSTDRLLQSGLEDRRKTDISHASEDMFAMQVASQAQIYATMSPQRKMLGGYSHI
ncbi:hypothetical protein ONZ45_g10609 [Pleurotus djamor]|nr:hypothetical protein ONZ45_g10609 [Pleurotus djamor]